MKKERKVSRLIVLILSLAMIMAMSISVFADTITRDDALNAALKNAKLSKSQVKRVEVEYDDEENIFEVEFVKKKNKAEYDYDISAEDGTILEKSVDYVYKHNRSKSKIGKSAAIKKVAKFSGIKTSVIKTGTCILKRENREYVYKIKFVSGNRKYEYEVLAPTGKIIEYEWELIS